MLKLKKTISVFLAILMVSALSLTAVITPAAKDFSDVAPDNAYAEQIDMLSDIGVIVGTTDTEFSPNEKVTREQARTTRAESIHPPSAISMSPFITVQSHGHMLADTLSVHRQQPLILWAASHIRMRWQ